MTEKFEGIIPQRDKSAQAYEDTAEALRESGVSLTELEQKRSEGQRLLADFNAENYTDAEDIKDLEVIRSEFDEIDRKITEAEATQMELKKSLDILLAIARKAAYREDGRRRSVEETEELAKTNHEALKDVILPSVHEGCIVMRNQGERMGYIFVEMIQRADDIEKRLVELLKEEDLTQVYSEARGLFLEFDELKKKMAEMHQQTSGWSKRYNILRKE